MTTKQAIPCVDIELAEAVLMDMKLALLFCRM